MLSVTKRDDTRVGFCFNKVARRINNAIYIDGLSSLNEKYISCHEIALKVEAGIYDGIHTADIDKLISETTASMVTRHSDYSLLASRISISALHKDTHERFSDVIRDLRNHTDINSGNYVPCVTKFVYDVVQTNADYFDNLIDYSKDFTYDFFAFKTLERSYLLKIQGRVVERPQQLLMRVAIGIHGNDLQAVAETYKLMSEKWFTHASPTLFNAGTPNGQLSSCFLMTMKQDSIDGIFETLKQCALISKAAGGIGLSVHQIRAEGTYIAGTNGNSNGLVPMLRVYNDTARYVDQGGNKRPGAFAIYLEPWHSDIIEFLNLRKNHGQEELRARDLFTALWIPDLFMKRVKAYGSWSLMCPHECPGLADVYGDEFVKLYESYEEKGKFKKQIKAQELWYLIIQSQIETGTPYMLYKDACNEKSNQKNLGTIKGSNLCTEIIQFSSPDEIAVCNLASIALNKFVEEEEGCFDFQKLLLITKVVVRNLNKVIDVTNYPVPEGKLSNLRHRPIGIGVQGLADTFVLLRYPYDSPEARQLNKSIFETIYYAALEASCELAEQSGSYSTYFGSPVSQGVLQFDMWNVIPSALWDWSSLREKIKIHGIRNSLLVAPMPTASTAQIMGNNESTEPFTSNLYTRRVISGEFQVINEHLLKDLIKLNLWDDSMKNKIVKNRGSIKDLTGIPTHIQSLYKTVWEISQKTILEMAEDRGAFIDQSQSLNIHIAEPTYSKMSSMHFFGWERGLKTGMYYLRTKPAANAIQFTVTQDNLCKLDCTSCSA